MAVDDHAALLELDAVDLRVRAERVDDAAVRPERGNEELELVVVAAGRRRTREGGALLEGGRDRLPVGVARPPAPPVNPRPRVAGAKKLGAPSGAPVGAGEILGSVFGPLQAPLAGGCVHHRRVSAVEKHVEKGRLLFQV